MFHRTAVQAVWDVYMLSVVGLSLWRGGWAERTVGLGMIADSVGSAMLQNHHDWAAPQWGDLGVDVVYLAVLLGVALRSDRLWTLFPAAFQMIAVIIYAAKAIDARPGPRAPYVGVEIWSYLILTAVAVGVWQHRRPPGPPAIPPSHST